MAHQVIGIDIGGTKIAAALVDVETGVLSFRRQLPTQAGLLARHVAGIVRGLIAELTASGQARQVGISICEIVDPKGRLTSGTSIDWRGENLLESLGSQLPIHLVSDVRAAALAEAQFGRARGCKHVLYVSIGTGISSVLLIDGIPYAGAHGAAVVLTSAVHDCLCSQCGAVSHVSVERAASGAGLTSSYKRVPFASARDIVAAADAGEAEAMALVGEATRLAGQSIGQLANCLDPELILIGGGLGSAPGSYWQSLQPAIRQSIWSGMLVQPRIEQSMLGADAGVVGAALAAIAHCH